MALWLVACAKNAESPQSVEKTSDATTLALHFDAVAGLNPGANGQPAPVRVRIYELKNTASFARADYFALAERAQATLGADLIDQDEVLVQPGQHLSLNRSLNNATRQIGLVVGYREIDQARWRTVLAVEPGQTSEFQVWLDTRVVSSHSTVHPTRPAQ
jgi:type VI secretion system protein VasD